MLRSNCTHELISLRLLSLSTGEAVRFTVVSTCTTSMKDPSKLCDDTNLRNEELWESEHVIDSTQCTRRILEDTYQKYD